MRFLYQLMLTALVITAMTLMPNAANASTQSMNHVPSHLVHDRTPHVHSHGSHSHRG